MHIVYNGKVLLVPNTSDQQIINLAKQRLIESGIKEEHILLNYDIQELEIDDLYVSYEPPHLVLRTIYDRKNSGMIKMKNLGMIRI
jgi:hypothetical protein